MAAHNLQTFQPVHARNPSHDQPVLRRSAASVDDGSEPTKVSRRDFRRGRIKFHTEVWSLRKNVCSLRLQPEYLALRTKM